MTERFPSNSCSGMFFSMLCNTDDCNKARAVFLFVKVLFNYDQHRVPGGGSLLGQNFHIQKLLRSTFQRFSLFFRPLNVDIARTMHIEAEVKTAELIGSLREALDRKGKVSTGVRTTIEWKVIPEN